MAFFQGRNTWKDSVNWMIDLSTQQCTNFEWYAQNPKMMAELIQKAVDDALEAKGCSLELKLPDNGLGWESWLNEEYL